jgi:hypothetical protein
MSRVLRSVRRDLRSWMMAWGPANTIQTRLTHTQSLRHPKSISEANPPTDLRALQMQVRSAQLVQELMTHQKSSETTLNHLLLERSVPRRLAKELVPANTLLKKRKLWQKRRHQLLFSRNKHLALKALLIYPRSKELLRVNTMTVKIF